MTIDRLRHLAVGLGCAAAVAAAGCGGATQSSRCTVDEEALADRIADRVYEQLRDEGYIGAEAGAAASARSSGGERGHDGGGAITPRNIVNALRRGLQGAPSDDRGEP